MRLSPAIPFNVQNYLYGLTPIRFWPYVSASWAAMLPGTFMYVYLGHIAGVAVGGERERTSAEWIALGIGLAATIAVTVYITFLARQKLQEQTAIQEQKDNSSVGDQGAGKSERHESWPWSATSAALIALLALGAATYAQLQPEALHRVFGDWLGPPPAERTDTE